LPFQHCCTALSYGHFQSRRYEEKKLEAAHRKFQRRLLEITWKDKVRNEEIRKKTRLQKLELIIKKN